MAFAHIQYNPGLTHGALLKQALAALEGGLDDLKKIHATMQLMIDGDGSSADHFEEIVTRFGFEGVDAAGARTNAKAGFDELSSLLGKLTTDGNVSFVSAALVQAFSKFR